MMRGVHGRDQRSMNDAHCLVRSAGWMNYSALIRRSGSQTVNRVLPSQGMGRSGRSTCNINVIDRYPPSYATSSLDLQYSAHSMRAAMARPHPSAAPGEVGSNQRVRSMLCSERGANAEQHLPVPSARRPAFDCFAVDAFAVRHRQLRACIQRSGYHGGDFERQATGLDD